jgi:hypothetical protein
MTMAAPSSRARRAKQLEHGDLVVEVEVGERLVEQVQPRLLRQQGGDGQPLALAAGQRVHLAAAQAGEVHRRQRLARDALVLLALPGPAAEMRVAPISAVSSTVDWKASIWPCGSSRASGRLGARRASA